MSVVNNLLAASNPAGLIVYAAAMAFLLGSVALATHRDRVRERVIAIGRNKHRR
jgi:hypothetical protein